MYYWKPCARCLPQGKFSTMAENTLLTVESIKKEAQSCGMQWNGIANDVVTEWYNPCKSEGDLPWVHFSECITHGKRSNGQYNSANFRWIRRASQSVYVWSRWSVDGQDLKSRVYHGTNPKLPGGKNWGNRATTGRRVVEWTVQVFRPTLGP